MAKHLAMLSGKLLVRFVGNNELVSISDWALEILHEVASGMDKSKRPCILMLPSLSEDAESCLAGDKLLHDIRNWLSPPDPWKNHNIARDSRHEGTATWFVQGDIFSEWKSSGPSSLLWIHGKRQSLPCTTPSPC